MDSKYLEGRVRIPLSSLCSEHIEFNPPLTLDFVECLRSPTHTLPARISPETRDAILRSLDFSASQLRATIDTETIPLVKDHRVYYAINEHQLEAARGILGADHVCKVDLYCIPVRPRQLSDGVIFRNLRYYMASSWEINRTAVAQAWMDQLSNAKKKILASLLGHTDVVDAMDSMLCLPGYWDGLQLGNWGKHLAAHIDPLIINYWRHIKATALAIMAGHEDKLHLFDAASIRFLQYRRPASDEGDRQAIREAFQDKTIFPEIRACVARDRLEQNVLALSATIPSIQTFHENMKYFMIAAKILEKHIEVRPRETRAIKLEPAPSNLIENLRRDWHNNGATIEIDHGRVMQVSGDPDIGLAVMQAFNASLRYFTFLSSEAPLRGLNKTQWMVGRIEPGVLSCFYQVIKELGFMNHKIETGCLTGKKPLPVSVKVVKKRQKWRAGKPCCDAYSVLFNSSFLPQIFPLDASDYQEEEIRLQRDLIAAFFGGEPTLPKLQPRKRRLFAEVETENSARPELRSHADLAAQQTQPDSHHKRPQVEVASGNGQRKRDKGQNLRGRRTTAKTRVRKENSRHVMDFPWEIPDTRSSELYVTPPRLSFPSGRVADSIAGASSSMARSARRHSAQETQDWAASLQGIAAPAEERHHEQRNDIVSLQQNSPAIAARVSLPQPRQISPPLQSPVGGSPPLMDARKQQDTDMPLPDMVSDAAMSPPSLGEEMEV